MIKAIFLDFDGTTFSHSTKTIPESTIKAIRMLNEKGVLSFLATGRSKEEMTWFDTSEDKKITYKGEDIAVYVYDENGDCEVVSGTPTTINNVGYFEIKDEKLYWTGEAEEHDSPTQRRARRQHLPRQRL